MSNRLFLLEAKSTVSDRLLVGLAWLAKITREAQQAGCRIPVVSLTWTRGDGRPRSNGAWVMVPEWWFEEMMGDALSSTGGAGESTPVSLASDHGSVGDDSAT